LLLTVERMTVVVVYSFLLPKLSSLK